MSDTRQSFAQSVRAKPSRAEVRLEQIRDAAIELFTTHGYYGTSMEDIAARVGLSAPTLYHYVKSKQELFLALHRDVIRIMVGAVMSALRVAGESPMEQLEAFIRAHVMSHAEYRREVAFADGELRGLAGKSRHEVMALRDDYQNLLAQIIRRGNSEGTWSADETLATFAILAICNNVAVWYRRQGSLSLEEIANYYVDFVARALLRAPEPESRQKGRGR